MQRCHVNVRNIGFPKCNQKSYFCAQESRLLSPIRGRCLPCGKREGQRPLWESLHSSREMRREREWGWREGGAAAKALSRPGGGKATAMGPAGRKGTKLGGGGGGLMSRCVCVCVWERERKCVSGLVYKGQRGEHGRYCCSGRTFNTVYIMLQEVTRVVFDWKSCHT